MMRAFENRTDTAVVDEPFYAAWLLRSGADHPMREAVLAAQPTDPARVIEALIGPVPGGRRVFYQKHMAHHMTPDMDLGWMAECANVFLIRSPTDVLASYAVRRPDVTLEDIGVVRQCELFEREADRLGAPPPVIESADVLAYPWRTLSGLCAAVSLDFDPAMIAWPAGPRDSDGVWAPAWYDAVERSTGFASPRPPASLEDLAPGLRPIAEAATPYYERLARFKI
jgi:hypothetical protein